MLQPDVKGRILAASRFLDWTRMSNMGWQKRALFSSLAPEQCWIIDRPELNGQPRTLMDLAGYSSNAAVKLLGAIDADLLRSSFVLPAVRTVTSSPRLRGRYAKMPPRQQGHTGILRPLQNDVTYGSIAEGNQSCPYHHPAP